ncbi:MULTISPECIES: pentapeptide repeat-containing protein [unclassified Streptomyces]|uniref:pentapeptide repeat-containing protein n=1 Tax=unclassified Streptomyces TaxID=2593676 RepID=UPI00386BD283|nr:pentapeptide repeat-containing protein [Streptomyces sp. NBC_00932]
MIRCARTGRSAPGRGGGSIIENLLALFLGTARFDGARFLGDADFDGVHFNGCASFEQATFLGTAHFVATAL